MQGFIGKRRDQSQNLSFYDLYIQSPRRRSIQIVSSWESPDTPEHEAYLALKSVPQYSPVILTGMMRKRTGVLKDDATRHIRGPFGDEILTDIELRPMSVKCLNTFSKDIIVSKDTVWPPKSRHLQIRFDPLLYQRLRIRNSVSSKIGGYLRRSAFVEMETPILFKSTPEGAREFLVPTRQKGFAYALSQSPQQYKQILMASRIPYYFQFARCFRDEDHRADRQPEFTQVDLEMAFSDGERVILLVENMVKSTIRYIMKEPDYEALLEIRGMSEEEQTLLAKQNRDILEPPLPRLSYQDAMSKYGTDKPDLRIKSSIASSITQAGAWVSPDFQSTITNLNEPIVEACKFRFTGTPEESAQFVREFFDALPNTVNKLDEGSTPGVFFVDSSKPLRGLSALGNEAAEKVAEYTDKSWTACKDGDVIIIHARENLPHQGSSTELGRLRKLIYDAAVEKGLLPKDLSYNLLWVNEFPLFSPNSDEPGQAGSAGFSATHHPFTAPFTPEDVDLLKTDPLKAKGDHYDLVLNGVEIGGGSRRIHVAEVQEYVMRDVLKMTDKSVDQFAHLLEALRAGCPPHAGFALGLDRFIAAICHAPSVRDVIAFPKSNKGEDKLVNSPSQLTPDQQQTYHLLTES
ncbi:aspartyl-tRNA synthetase-like protein [Xylaria sp. CBS 124048]|nr:aspartyl-tRNA synthetase-like protein [Xylaria sp. CBS 124048]